MTYLSPIFFWSALLLPAVILCYLLRRKFKQKKVSSLIFWQQARRPDLQGAVVHKVPPPWILLLELLILILLMLAAVLPGVEQENPVPRVFVLDNSWSMQAKDKTGEATLQKARRWVLKRATREKHRTVYAVIAGRKPVLTAGVEGGDQVFSKMIEQWRGDDSSADIQSAVSLIRKNIPKALVTVVTDALPVKGKEEGIDWEAFGENYPNAGITKARRSGDHTEEKVLLEVSSFVRSDVGIPLTVKYPTKNDSQQMMVALKSLERRALTIKLKYPGEPVTLSLPNDALSFDNEVTLLPEKKRKLRVQLQFANDKVQKFWEKSLAALNNVKVVKHGPELLLTNRVVDRATMPDKDVTVMSIHSIKKSKAFVGPFFPDHQHPFLEGMSFSGLIWGGDPAWQVKGEPVLTVGNLPLITTLYKEIRMNFNPGLSSIQKTPLWPALLWNIFNEVNAKQPGLKQHNFRQNALLHFTTRKDGEEVTLISPDGSEKKYLTKNRSLFAELHDLGRYQLKGDKISEEIRVNVFNPEESNLTQAASGRVIGTAEEVIVNSYRSIAWLPLLLALVLISGHYYLIRKGRA